METVETDADCNEAAIASLVDGRKTLIITEKHSFVPPFSVLLRHRDCVSIVESADYFGAVKSHIGDFRMFVLVGHELDNFQAEFLGQMCSRLGKTIVHLRHSKNRIKK